MSTGRHAKKRAAEAEERLMGEQERLLAKAEAKKGAQEKDIEGQRIATMRARFGGQATDSSGAVSSASTSPETNTTAGNKFKTPSRLLSGDPMKQTILGMMLDNPNQQQGM